MTMSDRVEVRKTYKLFIGGKFPRLTATDPTPRLREMLAMVRSL